MTAPQTNNCPTCKKDFEQTSGRGRKRIYCTTTCRRAARSTRNRPGLAPAPATTRATVSRIAEDIDQRASHLLQAELADGDFPELLAISDRLAKEIGYFQSALVFDARQRGTSWKDIGQAAQISPATARERWRPDEVQRRLGRRQRERAAASSLPPPHQADGVPAARRTAALDEKPVGRGAQKLASALSFLHRKSQLLIRDAATQAGLSASHLSRILTGERLPAWPVVEALAHCYQADPGDLRMLWEAGSGVVLPARDSVTVAADRLRAALRGLHLAASSPSEAHIHRITEGHLPVATITDLLHGRGVPGWRETSRLVTALGGAPGDIKPLWEAVHYSFLATSFDIPPHAPIPPSQPSTTSQDR